jgi:uncharacterized Zn finger protein (UPF0148 family)
MTYYTICPTCGYKLLKAGDGSNIEIFCPKCGDKMIIEIKDGKITILKVLSNKQDTS